MERLGIDSPISGAPDHPDLKVTYTGRATKDKKRFHVSGLSPGYNFLAYNNTITAVERAIKERLLFIPDGNNGFKLPPNPPAELFYSKMSKFTKQLDRLSVYSHPIDAFTYANAFQGQKRERYLRAAEEMTLRTFEPRDAERKCFLKDEAYNHDKKNNPAGRAINPGSDVYIVETGRYLCRIEKKVYRGINEVFGHIVVMKGRNQTERGRIIADHWSKFKDPVCLLLDAKRFEQSVKSGALSWEHDRYFKYFRNDRYFRKLLSYQHINKGRARARDGRIRFRLGPVRGSGDFNTGLGNTLISGGLLYSYLDEMRLTLFRCFIDGDDAGVIIERDELYKTANVKEWYDEVGFRMKLEDPRYMLEHVDFCQSRPVWTSDGYIMIRNVLDALSKDTISRKDISSRRTFHRWMAAVGKGGICLNGGIPIMQSFYQLYDRSSNGAKPLPGVWDPYHMAHKFKGMNRTLSTIDEQTRFSFYLAFDILPDEQRSIEQYYDEACVRHIVCGTNHPEHIPILPWGAPMPGKRALLLQTAKS